jgi:chromosome segregation ATPase
MSEINDQCSDTSSDLNWPLDHTMERQHQDQVVFENVADQYVKGEDVTAFFTIVNDIKVNPEVDQIGLLRVGCTNIKDCLAYAPVQFNPSTTSGSTRHGTAIFPSSSLPVTDDEFYQFCYLINKTKNYGSSIPFQLNCSLDDIDLLSNTAVGKTKSDGLIALADYDNDDLVVIHTRRMLTEEKLRQENRQLSDMNRRLEAQRDECQMKLSLLEAKTNEHVAKAVNDIQSLTLSHKAAVEELTSRQRSESKLRTDYEACVALCSQHQAESVQHAERCVALENNNKQIMSEATQVRSQLAVTSQLAKDQATQIICLERRLMQSEELIKSSNQRQVLLEQQIRDLRLTHEKHQMSIQGQINEYKRKISEINALETANNLLQEEIKLLSEENERLIITTEKDKELQQEIDQLHEHHRIENESAQNEIETLRTELNEMNSTQQAYMNLKASFIEIEKRCVKHQKSEVETKRQLSVYQGFVNDLQREIQDLTERLTAGTDEYKTLYRKYVALGHTMESKNHQEKPNTTTAAATTTTTTTTLSNEAGINEETLVSLLRNSYELQQKQQAQNEEEEEVEEQQQQQDDDDDEEENVTSIRITPDEAEGEIKQCPMCYWEFPKNITIDGKREHIEHHFQAN